jgi:hypothetical protein
MTYCVDQIYSAGYNKLKAHFISSDYFHYFQHDSLSCDFHPGSSSSSTPAPSVNALFCRYCKKEGHNIQSCDKKKRKNQKEKEKPKRSQHKNSQSSDPSRKKQRYPCVICDATDPLAYQCPRKEEVRQCLKSSEEAHQLKKLRWGRDEHISDEEN